MKLQSLSTLVAVIEQGSFAAAAERVNLTPSAVSLQMKQLEDYFRQPLFDRSGRQVRATAFAAELARTVARAMADIEAMRQASDLAPLAGRVRLGLTDSVQTTMLPRAFMALRQQAPQLDLHIEFGATPGLLEGLKSGRLDAAVLIRPPTGGSSRLRWTDLLTETFVLVAPQALSGSSVQALLRQQPWVRMDRQLVAGRLAAKFVDGLVPNKPAIVDLTSMDAIVAMVAAGVGVSVLPRLRPELLVTYPVREIELGRRAPTRQVVMVRRKADAGSRRLDVVERAFVDAAKGLPAR